MRAAYAHLGDEAEEVAERLEGVSSGAAAAPAAVQSPAGLLEPLAAVRALARGGLLGLALLFGALAAFLYLRARDRRVTLSSASVAA